MILIKGVAILGLGMISDLSLQSALLIGFALSFSSTVFAVKVFEARGEMGAVHGRIAIGLLIVQDIFAVVFIAASSAKIPSVWALLLFGLIPLRPLLLRILEQVGHGELLVLMGWILPLGGAVLFESVGVKADLGALVLGVVLLTRPDVEPSLYKDLSRALAVYGAELDTEISGVAGTVSVVRNDQVPTRTAPGMSLQATALPHPRRGKHTGQPE